MTDHVEKRPNDPAEQIMTQRSINPHIDKMETLQLWKAHHLQYVLGQAGPDFHSTPVVAVHPEEIVVPKNAATIDILALVYTY